MSTGVLIFVLVLVTLLVITAVVLRLRAPSLEDPVFGKLRRPISAWEGRVHFAPEGREVDVYIEADEKTGPDAMHHAFWEKLVKRYPKLRPELVAAIEKTLSGKDFLLGEGIGELRLNSVELPPVKGGEWSLSFLAQDGGYHYVFYMLLEKFAVVEVDYGYGSDETRDEAERRLGETQE